MLVQYRKSFSVNFIGDPHLGKQFQNGVPMEKRGVREHMQMEQFYNELFTPCHACVVVGDLFDKFTISNNVLIQAYACLIDAASQNPNTDFYVIMGNHDTSRRDDVKSSFDVLQFMVNGALPNIVVVSEPEIYDSRDGQSAFGLLPYDPESAQDAAQDLMEGMYDLELDSLEFIVGHWEIKSFGGDDHNLAPYELLCSMTDHIVTGHIHQPDSYFISPVLKYERLDEDTGDIPDKVKVSVVGSLQPYSHAEDLDGQLYITVTKQEYEADPSQYKDKCVRILMNKDEEMPEVKDVLQLTVKYVEEEDELEAVVMDNFNMEELFKQSMAEQKITEDSEVKQVWDIYKSCLKD